MSEGPRSSGADSDGYPFTDRWLELPAGRMHYVDEGAGAPILFVHGTPTWSYEWRHLIRAFAPEFRCLAPDHLGFGHSDRPNGFPYTPEAHAANLARFVSSLDLRDLTLVVHDYGGPIGLPICLEQPERVRRVALVNTWMWSFAGDATMERRVRLVAGGFGRFLYRWGNVSLRGLMPYAYGDRRKLTRSIHRRYLDRFPDPTSRGMVLWPLARAILGSSNFYDSLWRRRDRLRAFAALIVWGMRDPAFRASQLARWKEALPEAKVLELPASGHWPHEEEPEAVIAAMRSWFATTR